MVSNLLRPLPEPQNTLIEQSHSKAIHHIRKILSTTQAPCISIGKWQLGLLEENLYHQQQSHNHHYNNSHLLFIFIHVSTGHAHLSNDKIRISYEPDRPTSVFFSSKIAVDMAGKAWFNFGGKLLRQFSTHKRNPPLSNSA